MARSRRSWKPSLILTLLVFAVYGALFTWPRFWPWTISAVMSHSQFYPFHDMRGHLASCEAYELGMDIMGKPNPLDTERRPHIGPRWMLFAGALGVKAKDYLAYGISFSVLFLLSIILILRPQQLGDSILAFFLLCSPPCFLAVERANPDLFVVLSLLSATALLSMRSSAARLAAWGIVALLIGFKYYPSMAFAIFLSAGVSASRKRWELGAAAVAVVAFLLAFRSELAEVQSYMHATNVLSWFGSAQLLRLALLPAKIIPVLSVALLGAGSLAIAWLLGPASPVEKTGTFNSRCFILGSGIVAFCFAVTTSVEYKLIFVLPCMPYLLQALDSTNARRFRMISGTALLLYVILPWTSVLFIQLFMNVALTEEAIELFVALRQCGNWLLTWLLAGLWLRLLYFQNQDLLPTRLRLPV